MVWPPSDDMSATPGTALYCFSRIQSWMFLSCIGVRSGLWTTYRYTSPDGDDIGATDDDTPSGSSRSGMRSNTCCRAKYVSVRSSNVIVTSDRPYSETDRMTFRCGVPFMP